MKRASSIQEWVACMCAVAVKTGTETKKVKSLEMEVKRLQATVAQYRDEVKDLQDELTRYERDFLRHDRDLARCYNCDRYWSIQDDLFDCDGRCELRCPHCVSVDDCSQCGASGCSDCLRYCQTKSCLAKLCPACVETNTDCSHRMCENHNAPCEMCPGPSSSSSSDEK